jgi:hypothetical protein
MTSLHNGLVAVSLWIVGSTALAAPCAGFTDVQDTDPFCASVAWIKNRGVTQGCTASAYCPNDPVTRLQMAAFLSRLGDSLFPVNCPAGSIMKWSGSAWACAADGSATAGAGRRGLVDTLHAASGTGQFSAVAIGADGLPLVAYFDQGGGDLRLLRCADVACSASTSVPIDTGGVVGHWPSMTIRNDGRPAISYYDVTNTALKVAFCGDAVCSTVTAVTVDNAADVGNYSSIVNDWGSNGQGITVAYYDATNRDLKVASCGLFGTCGTPTIVTLASAGNVGEWSAATVDAYNRLAIAYFDATNKLVRVAFCDFTLATCAPAFTQTIASTGAGTAEGIAITTSGSGGVAVSYLLRGDPPFDSPVIAACATPNCDTSNVQRYLNFGTGTYPVQPGSIGTGPDGVPVAVFGLSPSGSCATSAGGVATNHALRCTDAVCSGATFANLAAFGTAPSIAFGVDGVPIVSYWRCGDNRIATLHCANVGCGGPFRPR